MPAHPIKGMVLAAGFGTRLRPITNLYPKPLVPFLGSTPLELATRRLSDAGIEEVAINGHYLAEQIESFVRSGKKQGKRLHYSFEPEILGTGGAYNPIRPWLGTEHHLLAYNGDVLTHIDLTALIQFHFDGKFVATMAVLPKPIAEESGVYCSHDQVLGFGKSPPDKTTARNFACVQILSPQFLQQLPTEGSFDIISQGYQPILNQGLKVGAFLYDGYWEDIRNLRIYLSAQLALLDNKEVARKVWGEQLYNDKFPVHA